MKQFVSETISINFTSVNNIPYSGYYLVDQLSINCRSTVGKSPGNEVEFTFRTGCFLFPIFRNLNTIRAINQELGEPVDRFVLMARWLVSFIVFVSHFLCLTRSQGFLGHRLYPRCTCRLENFIFRVMNSP